MDAALGLETATLPGGRYVRARLTCEAPAIYAQIKPTFDALVAEHSPDRDRPALEFYRAHGEIDLFLAVP